MDARRLQAAIHAGRVGEILSALEDSARVGQRRYLMDHLRRVVAHADPGSIPPSDLQRLASAGFTPSELEPLTGDVPESAVHVPLVAVQDGDGFCRLMTASYDPAGTRVQRERYDPAARAAVADGFAAAAQALGHAPLEGFAFLPYRAGVLANVQLSGASLGAAAAVSAASVWSSRAVRPGTAVTGRVAGERVVSVGGMPPKVAALTSRSDIQRLVVPSEDLSVAKALVADTRPGLEVVGVATVRNLLKAALEAEARLDPDPERAVADAQEAYRRGWQGWQWPTLRERLGRLAVRTPRRRPDLQVRAFTMLAAVHRNLGNPAEALEMIEEGLAVLATEEAELAVPHDARTFLYRHLAVTLRMLCRFGEALEAANRAETHAREGRLRGDLAFALGTRGIVHLSKGEVDAAIGCQQEAMQHLMRHDPSYAPRATANLVEALGQAGRVDEARAYFERGLALARRTPDRNRQRTDEQWLRTRLAGALRPPEHAGEVRALLTVPCVAEAMRHQPLPGLLARRWLGLAEVDLREREAGYARLGQSPAAYPTAREPHVRFMAQLNVLYEAHARALHGDLDADAVQRTRLALTHLPETPEAAAYLSPTAADVLALLDHPSPDARALVRALEPLLSACRSLS
jgi:tetratricopeptide (TPR) repeat protein